ncbi:CRIB domain-containing protein RIC7 [Zostera marina]|uniref:CRIB domain-containing protein RIC7 n=1 Tax=Zostera marina TaxID=29655 RepID=A0A0K9P922_ZOSMR|nr:CRIB domain-containing protein RIC7 [Zostera marina]
MNLKMKGLLKGLRYISHIFEPAEKEQEMQIGNPTDVKHVAHIGSDGPATNPPAWMDEYKSETNTEPTRKHSSQDSKPSRRNRSVVDSPEGSKPSRRNHGATRTGSSESSFKINNNGENDAPKQNRRHAKSKGDQDGTKPSRRKKNSKESPGQNVGGAADFQ